MRKHCRKPVSCSKNRSDHLRVNQERRPVRGEGPLGEDGCSSAARQCWWRARLDVMPHTGLDGASHPSPSTSSVRFPDRSQTTLNRSCNDGASRPARARLGALKSSSRGPRGFVRVGRVTWVMKTRGSKAVEMLLFQGQQVCHSKRQLEARNCSVYPASHTYPTPHRRRASRLSTLETHITQASSRAARIAQNELQLLSHRVSFAALRRSLRAAPRSSARARPFERLRNAAWGVDRLPKTDARGETRRNRQRTPRPRHVRESREGSRPTA